MVSLNVSYHKEQQYIWYRGWVLKSFSDIKPYMNWSIPPGNPESVSLNVSYHGEQQYIWFRVCKV